MYSTAEDVAKWGQALFGGNVLNQEYLDQMVTFGPVAGPSLPSEWTGYGLGAYKFNILERELWGGVGIGYGTIDLVAYLPEDSISIAVLINERYGGSFNSLMRNGHDILAALLDVIMNEQVGIVDNENVLLTDYSLIQNYPNPFNPASTIRYDLPQASAVSLVVYDILGREVARLVDGHREPGHHKAQWVGRDKNGRSVPSGIYIARLVTPDYTKSIKMVLLK